MSSGVARAPRALLVVNGQQVAVTECQVNQTAYRQTDTFSAKIPLDGTPGFDESFWSNLTKIAVSVLATNDANAPGFVTLFTGNVDEIAIDWFARVAEVSGRDNSAQLLETKTTEQFPNQSTAELVKTIASRVGLTADVSVPNDGQNVGLTYKDTYDRITDQDVLFNVLVRLAQREGCTFFATGTTLVFKPADQLGGSSYPVYYQRPTAQSFAAGNFMRLRTTRNCVLAKTLTVTVNSWRLKQKASIKSAFKSSGGVDGNVDYTYRAPNLTKQQADKIAESRLNEATSREKTVEIEMPGDVAASTTMTLALSGTLTPFDQSYIISGILHAFEQKSGYRMTIAARSKDSARTTTQQS